MFSHKIRVIRVCNILNSRSFSTSGKPKRSGLQPLPKHPQSIVDLEHKQKADAYFEQKKFDAVKDLPFLGAKARQMRDKKLNEEKNIYIPKSQSKSPLQSLADSKLAKSLGADKFIKEKDAQATSFISKHAEASNLPSEVRHMKEALAQSTAPTNLTRHYHSKYLINLWDPALRTSPLGAALVSSGVQLTDMDLVGKDVENNVVNLRKKLIQKNKISLVIVASSQVPLQNAQILQTLWHNLFKDSNESNGDGKINLEPIIVSISDGWITSLLEGSIRNSLKNNTDPEFLNSTILYFTKNEDDPISRARRFIGAVNRFVAHVMLIDERGLVRWRGGLAQTPSPVFVQSLKKVTDDLIKETKYDEAD